jgi:hypothetical protein
MPISITGAARTLMSPNATAVAFALGLPVLGACSPRVDPPLFVTEELRAEGPRRDGRVVLVTLDGVRWQDVFEGSDPSWSGMPGESPEALMPRTRALIRMRGVALGATADGCGTVHTASGVNVSFPGYLEIFTGHPSLCLDNHCNQPAFTVMDEAARAGSSASIASWDVLAHAVSGGHAGVYISAGIAPGETQAPFPGAGDYRPDARTAAAALDYHREHETTLFHLGLGDTDEMGHRGDYLGYLDALRRADETIGALSDQISAPGKGGEKTTVIITADHGRNVDFRNHGTLHPESGRTFILAFGARVPVAATPCLAHDLTLADLAPTIRVLMGLPRDQSEGAGRPIAEITGS